MIPGLEEANFLHLGSVHRNTFLNARTLLQSDLSSKKHPNLFFAGQITGVEGYTESASMGLYAASQILRRIHGLSKIDWQVETAIGALVNYIMTVPHPTPSNINFGLLPAPRYNVKKRLPRHEMKDLKKQFACQSAEKRFTEFLPGLLSPVAPC